MGVSGAAVAGGYELSGVGAWELTMETLVSKLLSQLSSPWAVFELCSLAES